MLHAFSLGLILLATWLLLSGLFSTLLIGLGVASVAAVVFLARRMDVLDREGHPIHLTWRAIAYFPWLFKEIIKANWDVARTIVDPALPITPTVIDIEGSQRSDLGYVTYANSITLTPGTVTFAIDGGTLTVHALTRDAAAELEGGEMDRRVTAMEGAQPVSGEAA